MRFFALIILSGIYCLFFFQVAQSAELKVVDNSVFVNTDSYEIQFIDGVITQLSNKLTGETYTLPPGVGGVPVGISGRTGLLRKNGGSIWIDQVTLTDTRKIAPLKARVVFRQGQNEIGLFITVDEHTDDLLIEQEGISDAAGVYGIQWGCGNLDVKNLDLILPADGGQIIDATSPTTSRVFHYPGSWEVQLAIVQGEQGGFFVRSTDDTFQFKRLHYGKDRDSFALGFETQNQAPFDGLTSAQSVIWRLNTYSGGWRLPAQQYRDWMERTFDPRRLDEMPAWVENIGLVVIYNGLNTGMLDRLAEQIDPTKTLLYLKNWSIDDVGGPAGINNYPDYRPLPGFGNFVEIAHQHGFRIMPHANLVGVSPSHPLYSELQEFQFRDALSGDLRGWHWERTESAERHAFINVASSKFRKILVQRLKDVWQKYRVDAFHLDVSHFVINDANGLVEGLNAGQGNALLHQELAEAMPGVVLGGEHLHEVTFFRESFAQRWILSSDATPHPISSFLFSPYTQSYAHLGFPNPDSSPQLYQEYLNSYESWGVLPTLKLWSIEQLGTKYTATQQLLSIARAWQQFGLRPDFEVRWGADTLFQYVGKEGAIATLKTTGGGSAFEFPLAGTGYERIFGVTQMKTDQSLPYWRAYNETEILGLNPEKSYLLSDAPRDLSQIRINSLPEGVFVAESRVTENAALFHLRGTDVSGEIDLLSQFNLVKTGIILNGEELPLQKGATFQRVEASVAGIRKQAIHAHPPWQGISGNAFGEWSLLIPDSSRVHLEFDTGLQDGADHSDGVTFIVSVQGDEIFRRHHRKQRWEHIRLDLTSYRGRHVTLRFITTPGPKGHTGQDWADWGEPRIVSEAMDTATKVGFYLPNEPISSFPDTVKYQGNKQYSLETELPARVLFFFEPGQQLVSPYNLRDTEFAAGLQFEGMFRLGSVWGSGRRMHGTAGGVRKETISAHPPPDGETILQFLLSLPQAHEVIFSVSMGLQDGSSSNGVFFKILLNGQIQFEHFTSEETPGWVDAHIPLSEFAGENVLLELVTNPNKDVNHDAAQWADLFIITQDSNPNADVNEDGAINILDMVLVGQNLGQKPSSNPRIDVNKDGQVNVLDLVLVAEQLGEKIAAAPTRMDTIESTTSSSEEMIVAQRVLQELEAVPEKSSNVRRTIWFIRLWLENANRSVAETKLLPNYPNPFNPETWIPYQLAEAADVNLKIYDVSGHLVRTISIGFKPVGYYLTRERAAYWDGRNEIGESVSSGVYFVQFVAGDFAATRRVIMVK